MITIFSAAMRHPLWQRLQHSACPRIPAHRNFTSTACCYRPFKEGDFVILRPRRDDGNDGLMFRLDPEKTQSTHHGAFTHSSIIGKEPRQTVLSSRQVGYRVHAPTLAEYVRLSRRLVTPLYPHDANLIVSLLDIHVDPADPGPPLEILEAGTGHGALTLHLSRAIHAANPPLPRETPDSASLEDGSDEAACLAETSVDSAESDTLDESWRAKRRAVVHTIDNVQKHSQHAQKVVSGFRNGMYYRNIDFHVGDVSEWIAQQKESRKTDQTFLSHVILDLPAANSHLANIIPALHVNGILAVFNPSITQIVDCVKTVREHKMPYLLEQVIELGAGTIREWDVQVKQKRESQAAKPQKERRVAVSSPRPLNDSIEESLDTIASTKDDESVDPELSRAQETGNPLESSSNESTVTGKEQNGQDDGPAEAIEWVQVCRPKAGQRVIGGGFLALWRKMERAGFEFPKE